MCGLKRTSQDSLCQSLLGNHAPTGREEGVCSSSEGDAHIGGRTNVQENLGFRFSEVKGSSYKYGGRFQFECTALMLHSITAGFKTKVEVGKVKTWDIGPYCSELFGAKYEIIRGTKNETVYGLKEDAQRSAGRKIEKNNGPWMEANAKKELDKQKERDTLVKTLCERAGAKVEETIKKFERDVQKCNERSLDVNTKIITELRVRAEHLEMRVKEMELAAGHMERKCEEFTRKTGRFQATIDAAMEIECAEQNTKANMFKMAASVQKFMASVVKLGE